MPDGQKQARDDKGFYQPYADAKNLRVWFIAYGNRWSHSFLTNESAQKLLLASGHAKSIAYTFLGGVAVQIFMAMLYKTSMWYLYVGELEKAFKSQWIYKVADKLSDMYWIEAVADLLTLGLFGCATVRIIGVFAP